MRRIILPCMAIVTLTACSSIDCPLNSAVATYYKLAGNITKLSDTLTISTTRNDGNDTVILNRATAVDSFSLPMSHAAARDTFYFEVKRVGGATTIDTVRIAKEDHHHFESIDCNPAVFHKINGVECTHHALDSIVVKKANVDYDYTKAHFHVYFKAAGE